MLCENQANEFLCLAARSWLRLPVLLLSSSAALSCPFPTVLNSLSRRGNDDGAGKVGYVAVVCVAVEREHLLQNNLFFLM